MALEDEPKDDYGFDPFDAVLGDLGAYQIWCCFLVLLSAITISWQTASFIFLGLDVRYECEDASITSPCSPDCHQIVVADADKLKSIVGTWKLVCDDAYKNELAQSVLILGSIFGNILFGHLSNQLGRRPTFLTSCMICLVMGFAIGLSPWYWFFSLCRFFLGVGLGGLTIISHVLLVELVGSSKREVVVVLYYVPYCFGHATLPIFAYFIQHWRHLQFALSALAVTYISFFWLIPESSHWLFATGRLDQCVRALTVAAQSNGAPTSYIRPYVYKAYEQLRGSRPLKRGTLVDVFRKKNLRRNAGILSFAWFALFLEFFGVIQYLTSLKGNVYVNVGMGVWLAIPGVIAAYPLSKYIGRRIVLIVTNVISAVCLLAIAALPDDSKDDLWRKMLCTVPLALSALTFTHMHLYSTELFPTVVRKSTMGLCVSLGRLGCAISPFVTEMREPFWIPPVIFGSVTLIATFTILFLPETKDHNLPDTIE